MKTLEESERAVCKTKTNRFLKMKQIEVALAKLNGIIWHECRSGCPDEELIFDLREIESILDEMKRGEAQYD